MTNRITITTYVDKDLKKKAVPIIREKLMLSVGQFMDRCFKKVIEENEDNSK